MTTLLSVLEFIRLMPWKGIQLLVQNIVNLFSVIKCRCKFLQPLFKMNALLGFVQLIWQIFGFVSGKKK